MDAETARHDPPPAQRSKLRFGVLAVAIFQSLYTLSSLSVFGDLSEYESTFAQWILFVGLAIFPPLAIAAVVFAVKGDIRRAIMAIAAIPIVAWVTDDLPALFIHGVEFLQGGFGDLYLFVATVVLPVLAVAAMVLAYRNQRLVLAAVFASLPTLTGILSVAAFAIGVMIYGF
jgi:hypothetical protein